MTARITVSIGLSSYDGKNHRDLKRVLSKSRSEACAIQISLHRNERAKQRGQHRHHVSKQIQTHNATEGQNIMNCAKPRVKKTNK